MAKLHKLADPITIGNLRLKNRVVMALALVANKELYNRLAPVAWQPRVKGNKPG